MTQKMCRERYCLPVNPSQRGFAPVLIAIGILSVLAVLALSMSYVTSLSQRSSLERINRMEGFYAGELIAWHTYFLRGDGNDTGSETEIRSGVRIDSYSGFQSGGTILEPPGTSSIHLTLRHAPTKALIRRYDGQNTTSYFRSLSSYCGNLKLKKRHYGMCLAVKGSKKTSPVRLVHLKSRLLEMWAGRPRSITSIAHLNDGRIAVAFQENGPSWDSRYSAQQDEFIVLGMLNPDGTIHRMFGDEGYVSLPWGRGSRMLRKVLATSDNKLIAVGASLPREIGYANNPRELFVTRLKLNGMPDETFAENGTFRLLETDSTSFLPGADSLVQPDGKIVTALSCIATLSPEDCQYYLLRLDSSGRLDSSFGSGGKAKVRVGVRDAVHSIALQSDGKIVAAAVSQKNDLPYISLVRFISSGTLDSSFGTGGKTEIALPEKYVGVGGWHEINAVKIDPSGKILLGGKLVPTVGTPDGFILRLDTNGGIDKSFGSDGLFALNLRQLVGESNDSSDLITDLEISPDNNIVGLVATDFTFGKNDAGDAYRRFVLIRLRPDGSIDSSFATNSVLNMNMPAGYEWGPSEVSTPHDMVLDSLDNWVVAGDQKMGPPYVARLSSSFVLDSSFGKNGFTFPTRAPSIDFGNAVAFQADGKIVVGGGANFQDSKRLLVTRLDRDLNYDPSFGTKLDLGCGSIDPTSPLDAIVGRTRRCIFENGTHSQFVWGIRDLILSPSGLSVFAGSGSQPGAMIGRFLTSGVEDTSFGINSIRDVKSIYSGTTGPGDAPNDPGAQSLVWHPTGRYLVSGWLEKAHNNDNGGFAVVGITPEGHVDTVFGQLGAASTKFEIPDSTVKKTTLWDTTVDDSGRIIAVGGVSAMNARSLATGATMTTLNEDIAVARFLPNGQIDSTFGDQGRVNTDLADLHPVVQNGTPGPSNDYALTVVTEPGGSILVGGCSNMFSKNSVGGGNTSFSILARYGTNGKLNSTFGKNGKIAIDFSPFLNGPKDSVHSDCITDLHVLIDGKIIALVTPFSWPNFLCLGDCGATRKSDLILAVLNPDGTFDKTAGEQGIYHVPFDDHYVVPSRMAFDKDGSFAVTGYVSKSAFDLDAFVSLWKVESSTK